MKITVVHEIKCMGDLKNFDAQTDLLYDALLDMADVEDPDLTINLATGEIVVYMNVEGEDRFDATAHAICLLRTAIHGIGGGTPGWEDLVQLIKSSPKTAVLADA